MGTLRRRSVVALLATGGLALAGCSLVKPPELTPAEVISKSADALKAVKSVHFKLSATNGMMAVGTGLVAKTIEGDVVQPDRLQGKALSTFGRVNVEISFIVVGTQRFITNPITKKWEPLPGAGAAPNLLDPDRGAAALIRQASNVKKLPNEVVGGIDCYHVTGEIASSLVAGLVGAVGADRTLSSDVWVATTDFLLRQIRLVGPVSTNEPPDIQRTLELSDFNEAITIDSPV
jgi:lipoprotein LprG